jgi:hypothetical protein
MAMGLGVRIIERLAADRAETSAVDTAENLGWKRQCDRVMGPTADLELLILDVGAAQLLVTGSRMLDLARIDLKLDRGVIEAAVAGAFEANAETKSQCIASVRARHVEARVDDIRLRHVVLTPELERQRADRDMQSRGLAVGEREPREIDGAGLVGHAIGLPSDDDYDASEVRRPA